MSNIITKIHYRFALQLQNHFGATAGHGREERRNASLESFACSVVIIIMTHQSHR